jgi:hypothetical protein
MNEHLSVATRADGVETTASGEIAWNLPAASGETTPPGEPTPVPGGELVLRRSVALLDALDERIFFAEPMGRADDTGDTVRTASARLTAETAWGWRPRRASPRTARPTSSAGRRRRRTVRRPATSSPRRG